MDRNKDFVFGMKAAYLAAFAHPIRLQIIELLRKRERSVGAIARALTSSQPSISKHLAILRQQGIVASRQDGVTVYYRVADDDVLHLLKQITRLLKTQLIKGQAVLNGLSKELP
jgi:ArsR family transcriptional regulator